MLSKAPRFTCLLFAALVLGALPGRPGEAQERRPEPSVRELWYRLTVDGVSAGWLTTREERGDEHVVTRSKMHLVLRALTDVSVVEMESRFTETLDGQPVEAWTKHTMGETPVEFDFRFQPDALLVRVRQGDSVREEQRPLPERKWLTPGQVEATLGRVLEIGATDFVLTTIEPLLGFDLVRTRWTLASADREEIQAAGQPVVTTRWQQRQQRAPQSVAIAHLDAGGRLIRHSTPMMGMEMTMTLSTRESATAASVQPPPEIRARLFVPAPRRIDQPEQLRRAVYEIDVENGKPFRFPSVGSQRAELVGATARVVVEVGSSPIVAPFDTAVYLRSSTFLDADNPEIRDLARQAVRDAGTGSAERAEAIRAFVFDYIDKSENDTRFATASEVVATRRGDCTEHAVLLAALLRAARIPARTVSGLLYFNWDDEQPGLWGFHMWAQAFVDGRWMDLDAISPSAFDAAHIAIYTDAQNADQGDLGKQSALMTSLGTLRIRLLESDRPQQ